MTPIAWLLAGFGCLFALAMIAAIAFDVAQARRGRKTISRWVLEQGSARPWTKFVILAVFSFFFGYVCGAFSGHFWFPQTVSP